MLYRMGIAPTTNHGYNTAQDAQPMTMCKIGLPPMTGQGVTNG